MDHETHITLDLRDFAAQQAVKHFLALHGESHLSDPDPKDPDPVLVQARNAFTHYADDLVLAVSDGTHVAQLWHAGSYIADYEADAIGRDAFVRECLDDLPDGHEPGLWLWRGRATMRNNGRGWDELYDEWVAVFDGEWTRATLDDLALLQYAPEQWTETDDDRLDDERIVAGLRAQFPDSLFSARQYDDTRCPLCGKERA